MIGKAIVFFAYSLGAMLALNLLSTVVDLGVTFQGTLLSQGLVLGGLSFGFMLVYALVSASIAAAFSLRSLGRLAEIGISNLAAMTILCVAGAYLPAYVTLADSTGAIIGGAVAAGLTLLAGSVSHPFAWFQTLLPVRIIDED
ncbi:MAG: hypothetical protein K2X77_23160 [Candidatus Obscuribacterales bacterium]|jgi:hypothetical protein|nr:hypothetical protein [Candidatus Obscuribacterales bacterium]